MEQSNGAGNVVGSVRRELGGEASGGSLVFFDDIGSVISWIPT